MDIIPHTAEELRAASDAVHTIAGLLLAVAAGAYQDHPAVEAYEAGAVHAPEHRH